MCSFEVIKYYWDDLADPRTKNWPLISSPWPVTLITLLYVIFVKYLGPQLMKNRAPYSLKTFTKYYNMFQIISNVWIIYEFTSAGWFKHYTFYCEPLDYTYRPHAYKIATVIWWVLVLKMCDYVETCVFVLRKKNNQVSFLHIYHHISTVFLSLYTTRYIAGAMSALLYMVNCSVHVVMYTYYLLSTMGETTQRLIAPIKPYITVIQMVQLGYLLIYVGQALAPSCPVSNFPAALLVTNLIINILLFWNFYQKSYIKKKLKD